MSADIQVETVTDQQLSRYARLIYERTGISISPQKKTLLSNRLRRRLRETGIGGYDEYYKHLKQLPASDPEWDAFLQEITTHETYLFRDEGQWNWFQRTFLADVVAAVRNGQRRRELRIWSAACSTGDEVYTIATCIAATITDLSQWSIQILGTDIGIGALRHAQAAEFNQRAMRLVPPDYQRRFFSHAGPTAAWKAKPILTSLVRFRQHNLMQPLAEKPFDLVMLKNVLIYFDKASKQQVLGNVKEALRPGGLLVTGAAEGVSDLCGDMQRVEPWLYRKPQ